VRSASFRFKTGFLKKRRSTSASTSWLSHPNSAKQGLVFAIPSTSARRAGDRDVDIFLLCLFHRSTSTNGLSVCPLPSCNILGLRLR